VLGLSDFEIQRIGVAAAVSFLGGVIQVSNPETCRHRKENSGKGKMIGAGAGILVNGFVFPDDKRQMCFLFMVELLSTIYS
jgi:hypothetical protein